MVNVKQFKGDQASERVLVVVLRGCDVVAFQGIGMYMYYVQELEVQEILVECFSSFSFFISLLCMCNGTLKYVYNWRSY